MLDELVHLDDTSVSDVLTRAVAAYWGQRLHATSSAAYEALRTNPEAWQAYHTAWEATLLDRLAGYMSDDRMVVAVEPMTLS